VQGQRFALAHAGAEDDLVELGERVIDPGAVAQECDGLLG
jgi:hypothetical protein